jgi:DNA polymerase elongation subunit (family B)
MNKWFYTNIEYVGDNILIKGYKEDGTPILGKVKFNPFVFVRGSGDYVSFEGNTPLRKVEFESYGKASEFVYKNRGKCYGMGVNNDRIYKNELVYAFLSEMFPEEIMDYNADYIGIMNYDIETSSEYGFPNYLDPKEEILSISCSVLRNGKREYKTFGIKPVSDKSIEEYVRCDDEHEMLKKFCEYVRDSNVDILTGWNSTKFDMPYICARIEEHYDKEWLKLLSPFDMQPKRVRRRTKNPKTGLYDEYDVYEIAGISDLDMMKLYGKFDTYNGSHALNNIANRELGEKKLDYSEYGSLHKLWKSDWDKFIRYNQQDVILVDKLVDKLKYVELAITVAYLAKIKYEDCFSPVKTWDSLIYNFLIHQRKTVIPLRKYNEKEKQNRGGRVKDSKKGFSEYVVTTDAESLYPSIMVSLNISPETFVMKIDVEENKMLHMKYKNEYLKDKNWSLAANGCAFDNSKEGVVSHLVDSIFQKRKYFKNKMKEEMKKADGVENLIKKYDVFQYSFKILINAAYGVMASPSFRYYNIDIAEAITITGQTIIQLSDMSINDYLNKYLGTNKDYVVFSDTDSCGIEMKNVILKDGKKDDFVNYLDSFYNTNIDPVIKEAVGLYANYSNFYKNRINFKREKIIEKMIITGKKRYGMIVHDSEGYRYKEPEIVIKGLEVVRSDTPDNARKKLEEATKIILTKSEQDIQDFVEKYRTEFMKLPLEEIAQPTGVYGLDRYRDADIIYSKGTPSHIKAALVHNDFVIKNKLEKDYELIKDGDKIKLISLKMPNPMMNDRFAVKNSFDKIFGIDKYIDYNKQYQSSFLTPLERLLDVIFWKAEPSTAFDI